MNVQNAEKINDVVAKLHTDSRQRGSSAAQSQGIDIRYGKLAFLCAELSVARFYALVLGVFQWMRTIVIVLLVTMAAAFLREDRFSVLMPWKLDGADLRRKTKQKFSLNKNNNY